MDVKPPGTWEIQWHPAAGGLPRRWFITPRLRRYLAVACVLAVLVVLFLLGLLPLGAKTIVARWSIDGVERDSRVLRGQEAARREDAVALIATLSARIDRSRRLAWTLALPDSVWRAPAPPEPAPGAADAEILAWLGGAADRLAAVGEALRSAHPMPPCPLEALPTGMPVKPAVGVPVALYGWRTSPFTGQREPHFGVTVAAPLGEAVVAPGAGTIRYAGTPRERRSNEWTRFGTVIVTDHGGGVVSILGGLATVAVKRGDRVRRGQPVGTVGQSPWSRVPAVYLEIRWPVASGSRPIDPALVSLGLPSTDLDARLAAPTGDLTDDYARLEHLLGRR